MKNYKGILIDLDDTIYDYENAHNIAIHQTLDLFSIKYNLGSDKKAHDLYKTAKSIVHIGLAGKAASHNRLLYFQNMLELIGEKPFENAMMLYNMYWDTFLENMIIYKETIVLLEYFKKRQIPVCLLTDLTAHIQYRKIEKLNLSPYLDYIVTSEEAGVEKPHPYMFLLGLKKLGIEHSDALMIGDNYKKDIAGSMNLSIDSIWINHKNEIHVLDKNIIEVKNLDQLGDLVK